MTLARPPIGDSPQKASPLGYWLVTLTVAFGLGYWISSLLPVLPLPFTAFQLWRARLTIQLVHVVELIPLVVYPFRRNVPIKWMETVLLSVVTYSLLFFAPRMLLGGIEFAAGVPSNAAAPAWQFPVYLGLSTVTSGLAGAVYFGRLYRRVRGGATAGVALALWPWVLMYVLVALANLVPGRDLLGRQGDALLTGLLQGLFLGTLYALSDLLARWASAR